MRCALLVWLLPAIAWAQAPDPQELASIKGEIAALRAELDGLRGQILNEGLAEGTAATVGPSILRLDRAEAELRRLGGRIERMENHIAQIVADGTLRLGDLEFRLVELEGGDLGAVGEPAPLGTAPVTARPAAPAPNIAVEANLPPSPPVARPQANPRRKVAAVVAEPEPQPESLPEPQPQTMPGILPVPTPAPAIAPAPATVDENAPALAVSEQADFDRAASLLAEGDATGAADALAAFRNTYPGSPLMTDSLFLLAEARASSGDDRAAARAWLDAFTLAPDGPRAGEALLNVGAALGRLGQTEQACQTLTEVTLRFPLTDLAAAASAERLRLCP